MRNKIQEYRYISMLYHMMFELEPEKWNEIPVEEQIRIHREWYHLRELEKDTMTDKARMFDLVIRATLVLASLCGISVSVIILLSGNRIMHYQHTVFALGIQTLGMLAFHLIYILWRWLWYIKLAKLALPIPIKLS